MAAVVEAPILAEPVPSKNGRSRKALTQKNSSSSEANILAGTLSHPSTVARAPEDPSIKENHESLSQPRSQQRKKSKKVASKGKQKSEEQSFEKDLQEMQEKLQQLKLEKEQTEEILKAKDAALKQTEEEKKKLNVELKRLQKIKEFKPNMVCFSIYPPSCFLCLLDSVSLLPFPQKEAETKVILTDLLVKAVEFSGDNQGSKTPPSPEPFECGKFLFFYFCRNKGETNDRYQTGYLFQSAMDKVM